MIMIGIPNRIKYNLQTNCSRHSYYFGKYGYLRFSRKVTREIKSELHISPRAWLTIRLQKKLHVCVVQDHKKYAINSRQVPKSCIIFWF